MNLNSQPFKRLRESIELMPQFDTSPSVGEMEKLVTSSSLIIIDDDLVSVYINPETEFGNAEADENVEAILSKVGDRGIYSVVVPDVTSRLTVEARTYRNRAFDNIKIAEVFVIKELAHRILAKAYMSTAKPNIPTRIFNSESEALIWVNKLKEASKKP